MLTIITETRRFVLKENEEQSERKFNEIIRRLLEPQERKTDIGKPQETENANRQQDMEKSHEQRAGCEYKGFLYIRCPDCGNEKGFCSKNGIHGIHCDECGCNKEFTEPLIPMYVNCECGGNFRYMTNKKEEMFDMTCIECGAPVPMKYNGKKNCYETIRN